MFSEALRDQIRSAQSVCVLTGAGISAESGVPTFRSATGIWAKFKPEELASMDGFLSNPQRVWEWYSMRRRVVEETEPNPGHYALVELEKIFPEFTLVTQNVDGLHERAGSRNILELHGNLNRSHCVQCLLPHPSVDPEHPKCGECGALIRPDVVWFGEMLPEKILEEAFEKAASCDLFLSIGTSGVVYPAASLPLIAAERGIYTVEVNPERTDLTDHLDELLLGKSGEILPSLVRTVREVRG